MSTIKLAVIVGVAAEAVLCGITSMFGHIGPCTFNGVAGIAMLFHLPGIITSELLFNGHDSVASVFIIVSGAVQFSLLAWLSIAIWNRASGR